MSEEFNKNFSTFISSNRHSKKSYFWIYFTSILSIILIILILCWYIYNKHSGYLKPPHLPFINDKTNCCQQQSSNISVAKGGLPELKNNSQQQQIWSTTPNPKPTISSPQYSQQQQNIFPLNTSPPKSATSFSEASNATGETSFNICEITNNEGGGNVKNEEDEIKNNSASWENKNEATSPLNPTITTTPLVDGQYRSTSSLALSHTPKTQLNQSRMEINDKNQKIPQEPLKSPPFPPPPPSQQHSTLPTIPESKRLAPPPPTDSVIKHKKLASLDENDEKIVENLDFNSPTNYFNNSKINEELLPSENQQQIYNNLNKNEYNGSNFNYPPLINNKEIQQSEIYLPEEDNQNSQQSSSSNSFPFTEVINNLNEEVLKNDEK